MPILTDEEADALDQFSAQYIQARMLATQQTPAEIIEEMVREKVAAAQVAL